MRLIDERSNKRESGLAMKHLYPDRLLRRIATGDNAAFEELYNRTKRGVFAFLHTYLHNYADTEDAMQSVYLKVKMHISSYKAGTNGDAWILQIAKNHALDMIRNRKHAQSIDEIEIATESFAEPQGVTEVMERVLSEEEQRIVTLHVISGYKHREIAELLDCPTGTVTSKYKRAIAKLQTALKEVD